MTYRVVVHRAVSNYLRGLNGLTREGRLAMYGLMDVLRDFGDEARAECPRSSPGATVFLLSWTFDAGPAIRTLHAYVDDSEGSAGLLRVLYADLLPLPDE